MLKPLIMTIGILAVGSLEAQETKTLAGYLHGDAKPRIQVNEDKLRETLGEAINRFKVIASAQKRGVAKKEMLRNLDHFLRYAGLYDLKGFGLSIKDEGMDYHSMRIAVEHSLKPDGQLWRIVAEKPHEFEALKLMPGNTVVAFAGDLRANELWALGKSFVTQTTLRGGKQLEELKSMVANMGGDLPAFVDSLGNEMALIVTMDPKTKKALPMNPGIMIPSFSVMFAVKTKNPSFYQWIAKTVSMMQGINPKRESGMELLVWPAPPGMTGVQLTIAKADGWTFVATNPNVVKAAMKVKNGAPGILENETFVRLGKGLPKKWNHMVYVSPELGKQNGAFLRWAARKSVLGSTNLDELSSTIKAAESFHLFAVTVHHEDALVLHSRSSTRGMGKAYGDFTVAVDNTLKKVRAKLEEDGAPMKLSEIIPPKVSKEENIAVAIDAAIETLTGGGENAPNNLFEDLGDAAGKVMNDPGNAKAMAAFRRICEKKEVTDFLNELDVAVMRPSYRSELNYAKGPEILLPHLSPLRNLSRIIAAKAMLQTVDGDHQAAYGSALTGLRTANLLVDEPTLISQLVRCAQLDITLEAVRRLDLQRRSPKELKEMERLMKRFEDRDPFIRGIDGERLIFGEWGFRDGGRNLMGFVESQGGIGINPYRWLPWALKMDYAAYLEYFYLERDFIKGPYPGKNSDVTESYVKGLPPYCILTRMFVPALSFSARKETKAIAKTRVTRVGSAIIRYHKKHGKFPKTLKDLTVDDLRDPFDEKPLRYARKPDGFVLYSVGQNLVDDGGIALKNGKGDIVWDFSTGNIRP